MVQPVTPPRRRARLGADLTILAVIGVLLLAAIGAGVAALHQQFYSPAAFVGRYLDMLATGRASDALRVPGVVITSQALQDAGLAAEPSEALLRRAALAPLTDAEIISTQAQDGIIDVTVRYRANGNIGTTTFHVTRDGWAGVMPSWRFAQSPLAVIDLTVRGSDRFEVNGFDLDRRQISSAGMDAAPFDPVPLIVFTPGAYSVTVDTPIATSPGVVVLADTPLLVTPVDIQAEPTPALVDVVQTRVEEFLAQCASQKVLMPTACPFGIQISDRLASLPEWAIAEQPDVSLAPNDSGHWNIVPSPAVARITMDVQSLFDGSIDEVVEEVPFAINGTVTILADGTASIRVGAAPQD